MHTARGPTPRVAGVALEVPALRPVGAPPPLTAPPFASPSSPFPLTPLRRPLPTWPLPARTPSPCNHLLAPPPCDPSPRAPSPCAPAVPPPRAAVPPPLAASVRPRGRLGARLLRAAATLEPAHIWMESGPAPGPAPSQSPPAGFPDVNRARTQQLC